jgi:hypothetical protein
LVTARLLADPDRCPLRADHEDDWVTGRGVWGVGDVMARRNQ